MRVTIKHLVPKGAVAAAVTAAAFAVIAVPQVRAGEECRTAVEAAFTKQREVATGYRFAAEIPGDQGKTQMTIDYLPPDRMYQKVVAPGHEKPVETIAIQQWAWGTMGGGWEELQPQFAQSIIAHVRQTLVAPPKITTEFTCLGKVTLGGKEFVAYKADQPSAEAGPPAAAHQLARTIYVDEKSGLPAANIVARVDSKDDAVFDGRYSYPGDIQIEAPIGGRELAPANAPKN